MLCIKPQLCIKWQGYPKNVKFKICTNSLPVVVYGCNDLSLTLREERRMRVFENRALRRIFGPKTDEVTGQWKRLHTEDFYDLYNSPSIVRVTKSRTMRWTGRVARMVKRRGSYRIWVRKPKGKRPLGRPCCRWGITINFIFNKRNRGWTGFIWLRI